MIRGLCLLFIVLGVAGACVHVGAAASATRESADAAYAEAEWPRAQTLYAQVLKNAPEDGRGWYRLAVAARHNGDTGAALKALDNAASHGVPPQFTEVERARVLAGMGRIADSIAAIRVAVQSGFASPDVLRNDPDFAGLQDTADLVGLVEQAQNNRAPCARRAGFRQFDFWVGEWEVRDGQGNLTGTNVIEPVEGGCYLREQWVGAGGTTGSSMNYYDAARAKWVQHWVSQGGTQIQIEGTLVDGSMVMSGKIHYLTSGQSADFRGTWTPLKDGRVRQFFEQSLDAGRTWSNWFEGFYSRKPPTPDAEGHGT